MADKTVPAERAISITPNDSADLSEPVRAIFTGSGGDIALIAIGDTSSVVFVGVAAGIILPVSASRVLATGTAATGLVGLV